jgi:small GTP-binding protein
MSKTEDYLFKIILIGDSCVGKSSVLLQYVNNEYCSSLASTIGIDFKIRTITIKDKNIKMQIIDSAGQERFRSITFAHYRNAIGIILMYDITDQESFDNINYWLDNIKTYCRNDPSIYLVGNKKDFESQRKISKQQGINVATGHNLLFTETSAKSGENINDLFSELALEIIQKLNKKENKDHEKISLLGDNKKNRKKCCTI